MSIGYDVMGNVALIKFSRSAKYSEKKKFASDFLKKNKSVKTVLEKIDKFSGRLRIQDTRYLAGEKTKEVLYKENGCVFRFNVDTCYFSPRLSAERKEIAKKVKKNEKVLVMFGGVAPFAIVIGKISKAKSVVSVELGKECSKYAKINVKRNKLQDRVEIVQGGVRRVLSNSIVRPNKIGKLANNDLINRLRFQKFDRIVMPRPNLKDSFLDVAFLKIKKNGVIHYYGFDQALNFKTHKKMKTELVKHDWDSVAELENLIALEAKKARKKVKIMKVKKAGDIGPYRYRWRVDIKIFN